MLAFDNHHSVMEKKLKVVAIFGFAGVAKTTLARTLYHQYGRKFQCRAFLRISRDPDMRRLLIDMLSQIKAPLPNTLADVNGLIGSITKHLQGKRYLVIIDDIWTTSAWDIISRALPDGDYCRIITTTQVADVALACCSNQLKHIYEITPLNDDGSGKSGGVCTNPSPEGMKEALHLVYNSLPPHLQTCLLYMNMYPEGKTIRKNELVRLWVVEGFIRATQGQDMQDTAGAYFDDLISIGMIQTVDVNPNGKVFSCTVHHMVLDLVRQKSMEENFVTIVNYYQTILGLPDKVRRLSVQLGGAKGANSIPEYIRKSQVRSLAFCGFFECVPSIVYYGLLRVLILHIWADQEKDVDLSEIGELYLLGYLKVECNVTVKLPAKIRWLQQLGTLQVDARLSAVPQDIVHLEKLHHLRVPSESILPDGVARMTSLRTLGYFDLGSNSEHNTRDLGKLANLQDLELTCSAVKPTENLQHLGSVLEKLSILRSVTLAPSAASSHGNVQQENAHALSKSILCHGLSRVSPAPAHLQSLELSRRCCIFPSVPKWIEELGELCTLKIAVEQMSRKDIAILKGLPALTALSLYHQIVPAERIVFDKGGFSVLRHFRFTSAWPWLIFEEDAMPSLEKVKLGFNALTEEQLAASPIIIRRLAGLKEISYKVGSAVPDTESALLSISNNRDLRNVKVNIQFADRILPILVLRKEQEDQNEPAPADTRVHINIPSSAVGWGISTAEWMISSIIERLQDKAAIHIKFGKSDTRIGDQMTRMLPLLSRTREAAEGTDHMELFEGMVRDIKYALDDTVDILDELEYIHHHDQLNRQEKGKFASDDNAGTSNQGIGSESMWSNARQSDTRVKRNVEKIEELIGVVQKTIDQTNLLSSKNESGGYRRKPSVADPTGPLNKKIDAITWQRYTHLDEQARRCFAYCCIFPRGYHLTCSELVKLWVAEGFLRNTGAEEKMEAVSQAYFGELVSTSFLQPEGEGYYVVPGELRDLAEKVAGSDCFIIQNGWTGEVPQDVRHLYIDTCDATVLKEKIFGLENLHTLIIDSALEDVQVLESMFQKLPRLRVLKVKVVICEKQILVPASIGQLKHLRYLAFHASSVCSVILPDSFTKLYHVQVMDFGKSGEVVFSSGKDMVNLTNLRHIISWVPLDFPNIGKLTSLQTLMSFTVKKKQGYELKQLMKLNKLRGSLEIHGLENVEREEVLEANVLAGMEQLEDLSLEWDDNSCDPDIQADVLEGLCPPKNLKRLHIREYHGSRYPDWMLGKQNRGPKYLLQLSFRGWSQPGHAPDLGAFIHVRSLSLENCNWDTLPSNIAHFQSLEDLVISDCINIRSLPALPTSVRVRPGGCNKKLVSGHFTANV